MRETNAITRRKKTRYFRHSYSQEGEDLVLAEVFQGKRNGFFVDVGAHHPKRFSNTYHFYRFRGWRGINIDAMPGSMKAFNRARPEDVNIEAAVSLMPQTMDFYIFNETALNTFDPALATEREGFLNFKIVRKIPVRTRTLTDLLDEHLEPGAPIDFLNVDVEGLDLQVLQSNDWRKYSPAVILVEDAGVKDWDQISTSQTTQYLNQQGYQPFAKTLRTMMYRRRGD